MTQRRQKPTNLPEVVIQRATPAPLVHTPPPLPGELQTQPSDPAPIVPSWVDAAIAPPPLPDAAPPPPPMQVYYSDRSEHHYHAPAAAPSRAAGDNVSYPLVMWVMGFLSATCLIGVLLVGADRPSSPPPPPPAAAPFPQVQP